jgi:hypothetical protein
LVGTAVSVDVAVEVGNGVGVATQGKTSEV